MSRPAPFASRFAFVVVAVSLALLLATVAVVARGDQVALQPVDVAPDPAAVDVSTGASLHIRFARPMRPASVEQRLRLEPPAEGSFQWSGTTLTFTPRQPLRPATDYTVTLGAGLEETRGRVSRQPFTWGFRTRTPQVVALQRRDGIANLWLIDPVSGAARQLTHERVEITDFSIAPDGNRIAFTRQDDPTRTSLWVVSVQSGATSRLSPDEEASFSGPSWSPRGDLIVFERRQAVERGIANPKLFAARADGTSGGLVYGRGDEVGFGARWSPDGTRLAFFDPIKQAVIVFNFTRDLITIPVQTTVTFDWSPDGRQLVIEDIVSAGSNFQHVLLLADATTGAVKRLPSEPSADDATPAWSPAGGRIAFTRRATSGAIGGAQPWLMAADGSQAAPLLAVPDAEQETTRVAWSPDGRYLLLTRLPLRGPSGGRGEIWLAEAAPGTAARHLAEGTQAAWLP